MLSRLVGLSIAALILTAPGTASADVRADLGRLADTYVALGQTESADQLRAIVDGLSDEELAASFGQVGDQLNRLIDLNMQLAISGNEALSSPVLEGPRSPGFPQPMFSVNCPESAEKSFDDLFA